MKSLSALGMIAAATLFCAAPLSLHWSTAKSLSLSVDTADARIGRPLTPMWWSSGLPCQLSTRVPREREGLLG